MTAPPSDPPGPPRSAEASASLDPLRFHSGRAKGYKKALQILRDGAQLNASEFRTCNDPAHASRCSAMTQMGVPWDTSRESEIRVLAELARATASAIRQGHLEKALELVDLQSVLLSKHSLACLEELVHTRPCDDEKLDSALEMLDELLRADKRLLVQPTEGVSTR